MIDKAIATYEMAIFIEPADPTPYYNLGRIYYNRPEDRERSLGYFLKARDLNPSEPDVHQYLGAIYREKGDLSRSAEEMALYENYRHR